MVRTLFATAALAAILAGSSAVPAAAQNDARDVTQRVGRLESEMRAVQRKVFPGGAGQVVQPEVDEQRAPASIPGTPSASALVDLTSRVTSLEGQMATLTGQIEQNGYRLRQLQDLFDTYRKATDARLAAMGPGAPDQAAAPVDDARPAARPAPVRPAPTRSAPARGPVDAADRPTAVDRAADPARAPASAATRPAGADTAEDAYLAGYRLWQARDYAAAETQLRKVVSTYPNSKRASYAQNLLGRAYLDDGKPSMASVAFYDNYKKMPDGERAPDSLYYLAQALMKLNKPADACKVYGELSDVYAAKITAGMKVDIARGRVAAKCP